MIKILHAADFHLDSVFKSLPPDKAEQRRKEQRDMIERIASLAQERRVQLVFLSGDLFDEAEKTLYDTKALLMNILSGIRAEIFISPGNHDYCSPGSPYLKAWPANVHIFKSPSVERIELDNLGCDVYGAGFNTRQCVTPLLRGFKVSDASRINLMALHGDTAQDSIYNPITESDIAETGLDYLALGHKHDFSGLKKAGKVCYAYPGCPEGRGFDETGDKGVIILEADKGKVSYEFVPIAKRRYFDISVDVSGFTDIRDDIGPALPHGTENDIFRITLTGETTKEASDLERITSVLEPRFYHVTLRDSTKAQRDIWEQAGEDTLKGLFLKNMKSEYDSSGEELKKDIELAVRFGLAALDNREAPKA